MSSSQYITNDRLHLEDDRVFPSLGDPTGQSVESTVFYFGGPLFGITSSEEPTVYTKRDGTRVIFGVDPRLAARVERKKKPLPESIDLNRLAGVIYAADKKLKLPTSTRHPIMDSNRDNENLLLLADVALGTYRQEGQQPAHPAPAQGSNTANTQPPAERELSYAEVRRAVVDAYWDASPALSGRVPPGRATMADFLPRDDEQLVRSPPPAEEASTNSTPPVEQPVNLASSELGNFDDYPPRGEQQPSQASTQAESSVANTNASPRAQQQPAQAEPSEGSIADNRTATAGGLASSNPHPLPRQMPDPIGPSGGLRSGRQSGQQGGQQGVERRSPRSKARTTGFNKETGEGMMTNVCGIVTPAQETPVRSSNSKGKFCCPRCTSRFTRPRSVKDHFIACVGKYGNPKGLSWWDHRTLKKTRDWHIEHLPTVKEEDDEEEEDGDKAGQEQDEEESRIAQAIESDVAAGEEDGDGDSRMGEEDHGRDSSVSSGSTQFYTADEGSDTPRSGPDGYRTRRSTNTRGWSPAPLRGGVSQTLSFERGYNAPVQERHRGSGFGDTDTVHGRETGEDGHEKPTELYDDDGDSVMS